MKRKIDKHKIRVRPHHIYWLRGMLMARERRDITLRELGEMFGVKSRQITYLAADRYGSSPRLVKRILEVCREHGIMVHLSDFYDDQPNPATRRTSPR